MRLFRFIKRIFLLIAAAALFICIDVYVETNIPKVNHVSFETGKIPQGAEIGIVQISDLHNMEFGEGNEVLLEKVSALKPDFIVLTGDMIDVRNTDYSNAYALAEGLVAINPNVFFVSGNHERWNTHSEEILEGFADRKVRILNYDNFVFNKGNVSINICGVEYAYVTDNNSYRFYVDEKKFDGMFAALDSSRYTILLSHAPKILQVLGQKPYDLILSGHTHGGQVRLPFVEGITYLGDPFYEQYDKGVFELGHGRMLYIDSGVGTSIIPVRFMNRSQISYIEIKGK